MTAPRLLDREKQKRAALSGGATRRRAMSEGNSGDALWPEIVVGYTAGGGGRSNERCELKNARRSSFRGEESAGLNFA